MPPKKVKQPPKNAFYYFMVDFKGKQGRSYKSMKEVADAAGPHWNRMTKEQKRPYEEKALMEKNNMRAAKYTSEGIDVEVLEQMDREEQQRIEDMKNDINNELKLASRTGKIQDKMFFIIHINTFCQSTGDNRHYPAEIAIGGFTLEGGVAPENVFHRMIKPGLLPLGYAGIALSHSKETHQISPPMRDDAESNMEQVFTEMIEFLQSKMQGSQRKPILYCEERLMKMVQQVLDMWCMDYEENYFQVYNLQYMFRILRNSVAGGNVWPSDTYSAREIEKDVNAYAKGISCEYHEITNVPVYCSRSVAVRYAYTICDNCCPDLNIEFIPGCHVPDTAFTAACSRPLSAASFASSRSLKSRGTNSSIREDDCDSVSSFLSKSDWENQSVTSETSSSHALHDEDDFPTLGKAKRNVPSPGSWKRFTPNDSSSVFSQSSEKSYAGATGTSGLSRRPADMPSSVVNSMGKLSLNSSKSSDSFSVGHGTSKSFNNDENDFPAFGRGRGSMGLRGRGLRRPNSNQ